MRIQTLALLLVMMTTSVFAADPLAKSYQALGECLSTNLAHAPFPHPLREKGYTYDGKEYPAAKHYHDNRVVIFIPKDFRVTGGIDFVVHFHGWRAQLDRMLEKFQLLEQFTASGKNAILVAPQGPFDAPDSCGGKLEEADGFRLFMDEVLAVLKQREGFKEATVGKVILSGHSGGYRVISSILDVGGMTKQIQEVYLFDALYGRSDKFFAWIEHHHGRLINIYTKDGGTKAETEKFIATLRSKSLPFLARAEAGVIPDELRKNRLLFLFTTLGHNEVLYEHHSFRDYLATSGLSDRRRSKP